MRTFRKRRQHINMNTTFIQPKLTIGKPGDKYEVEADAMADKMMNRPQTTNNSFFNPTTNFIQKMEGQEEEVQQKPLATSITPLVQKMEEDESIQTKCNDCEKEESVQKMEEEDVQTKSEGQNVAPTNIESSLRSSKGNGSTLSRYVKNEMESSFGADFSQVNIHTNSNAIQMNKHINAQAFTHGNDIYFNQGKYNPSSKGGKHLLVHELTHTIQQKQSGLNIQQQRRSSREIAQDRITTPIPANAQIPRRGNRAEFDINGTHFTILPDRHSRNRRMRNRAVTNISQRIRNPRPVIRNRRVAGFRDYTLRFTIRTTYGSRTNRGVESGYGRGTTTADIAARTTTLGFHEGNHGLDFINFVTVNQPPQFHGAIGMTRRQFNSEVRKLRTGVRNYFRRLNQDSIARTDCVGRTVDQHTGSHICPIPESISQ